MNRCARIIEPLSTVRVPISLVAFALAFLFASPAAAQTSDQSTPSLQETIDYIFRKYSEAGSRERVTNKRLRKVGCQMSGGTMDAYEFAPPPRLRLEGTTLKFTMSGNMWRMWRDGPPEEGQIEWLIDLTYIDEVVPRNVRGLVWQSQTFFSPMLSCDSGKRACAKASSSLNGLMIPGSIDRPVTKLCLPPLADEDTATRVGKAILHLKRLTAKSKPRDIFN